MRLYLKENPKVAAELEKNLRTLLLSDTPANNTKSETDKKVDEKVGKTNVQTNAKTQGEPPKKTTAGSTA